jgi:hypothetical protein
MPDLGFCDNCGASLLSSQQEFCSKCGARLSYDHPESTYSATANSATEKKGSSTAFLVVISLMLIGALVAGGLIFVFMPTLTTPSHNLSVSIIIDETFGMGLDAWNTVPIGGSCHPNGTFAADQQAGADVTISDSGNKVLAKTHLIEGVKQAAGQCAMSFQANVSDSDFYQIKVAQRPIKVISKTDLENKNWHDDWLLQATL